MQLRSFCLLLEQAPEVNAPYCCSLFFAHDCDSGDDLQDWQSSRFETSSAFSRSDWFPVPVNLSECGIGELSVDVIAKLTPGSLPG